MQNIFVVPRLNQRLPNIEKFEMDMIYGKNLIRINSPEDGFEKGEYVGVSFFDGNQ